MSLMHKALQELDQTEAVGAGTGSSFMSESDRARKRWLVASIGAGLLISAGAGAVWWGQQKETVAPATVPPAVPPALIVASDIRKTPAAIPQPAPACEMPAVAKPLPPVAKRTKQVRVKRSVAPKPPSVDALYQQFLVAMEGTDAAERKVAFDRLSAALPARSLSLLRARAWYAVKTDDRQTAYRAYQTILERQAGDEEASLNLAAMETASGNADRAVTILTVALRAHLDSASLQQAMNKLSGGI
jgi:hypothetical protein